MTGTSIIRIALCLLAGCSLALMSTAGGPVLAHGHHDDYSRSNEQHASTGHGWNDRGDDHYHRHRHHHHHNQPPLHGLESSHNPVVYNPPVKPIPKPVAGAGPVKQAGTTIVRDHRTPPPRGRYGGGRVNAHCNKGDITGCEVRDHRTPPPTQCLGDLC